MYSLFLFITTFLLSNSLLNSYTSFFNHWHCIGIQSSIDFSKPYKANIGDLPLVIWKNPISQKIISSINICKHMGSTLDNGIITNDGCLKCQYHGLEFSYEDRFGEIMEYEGKIFWAYKPIQKKPYSVPFFYHSNYVTSFLEIDMECSLEDSAYNTMDIRHPEYVHNKIVGFGNTIPPENIRYYNYSSDPNRIGMSFDYSSNKIIRNINDNVKVTKNYHMYIYPTFSWSKVSFNNKNLIIGVNLLPLEKKKTRWYITICHNYYTSEIGKQFMKMLALTILNQDFAQMKRQYPENDLKKTVLFNHIFNNEEPILALHKQFSNYEYPDINSCVKLYKDYHQK
jgi:phenylpropionate dioxygenase-like ring-hydroxylating dioxygenase large terminal subunit